MFANAIQKTEKIFKIIGKSILSFFYKTRYFWKKLGVAIITLILAVILIFLILRLIPGDTVHNYAITLQNQRNISYEEARELAVQLLNYDPDEPILTQFVRYVKGLAHGNLGQSLYVDTISANLLIKQRVPWTLFISTIALVISFIIGTWMGSTMARSRKGIKDASFSSFIILSSAIPDYIIGLLLVMVFSYQLHIFPAAGHYDIQYTVGFNFPFILNALYHAALPILAFVISQTGYWALTMRGSSIGVLGEDYIYAAKARGLPEKIIVKKYLKRNAMLPLITSLAVSFACLFGGAPLMESIFNYPGIGSELTSRIGQRDFFVVQGIMIFTSTIVIIVNLITDSLYSFIDPRVRRDS